MKLFNTRNHYTHAIHSIWVTCSQLRSSCSRIIRTPHVAPPSSLSYLHESPRLNSSCNNSLLDRLLDLTSLFSRSHHSIDQSITPFNRQIYPAVQSTNLSCSGRFGKGASLNRYRLQLFERFNSHYRPGSFLTFNFRPIMSSLYCVT